MPLQTAKEFASAAANMGLLATQFKPDDSDPYAQSRKLIQFHLISAANKAREIGEALAQKEQHDVP
jgi:hypothetical protein